MPTAVTCRFDVHGSHQVMFNIRKESRPPSASTCLYSIHVRVHEQHWFASSNLVVAPNSN